LADLLAAQAWRGAYVIPVCRTEGGCGAL